MTLEAYVGPISKEVTLPKGHRGNGTLKPQLEKLSVGESFETTFTNSAVHLWAKKLGIRCETRNAGGDHIRVWRVA